MPRASVFVPIGKPNVRQSATAAASSLFGASPDLKDGDIVQIEITGIGTLRNRFVKETAPGS